MSKKTNTQTPNVRTSEESNLVVATTLLDQVIEDIYDTTGNVHRYNNYAYRFCILQGALEKVRLVTVLLEEEAQYYL